MRTIVNPLCFFAVFLFLQIVAPRVADARDLGWSPPKTWLFVVGVLSWKHAENFGAFPVKLRRDADLVDFFKKNGVPSAHIVYLQDKQATQKQIDQAFAELLGKLSQDDLLIVYYAGHGYKSKEGDDVYLASYDAGDKNVPGWSVNSIPETINEQSDCKHVLWLIDCCYSGQAAKAVAHQHGAAAYACATSSSASESSTGHWTFTQALLDAWNGAAYVDLNHDGAITLSEFATHAEKDMSLGEEQLSTFATSNGFDKQMVLAQAKPLTNARIGERLKVQWHGDWYPVRVIDTRGSELKIHYIGYDDADDIWVPPDKLKPIQIVQYSIGQKVEVEWKKKWYPATILQVKDSIHYIHYTDYDSNWDEWVTSRRIRKPKA